MSGIRSADKVRPLWTKSLRFQLTAGYVAAIAAILLISSLCSYAAIRAALVRETDQTLSAEASKYLLLLSSPTNSSTLDMAVIMQSKPVFSSLPGNPAMPILLRLSNVNTGDTVAVSPALQKQSGLLAELSKQSPATLSVTHNFCGSEEGRMRCLTVSLPHVPYRLQVAALWDPTEDFLTRILIGIGMAGVLFLLLSGLGSWFLIGRALSPIDRIVTEAENLTQEPLGHDDLLPPVLLNPYPHTDNEIGHLVQALNALMSRLSATFAVQRQFTADASHELRTPLTILQGQMELALLRVRSAAEYRRTLESGLEETLRMARIVDDLMLLARGDSERSRGKNCHAVSLNVLTKEFVESLSPRAAEKNLLIVLQEDPKLCPVQADPDALRRLLKNLLENALVYTPSGGKITVTLTARETDCMVTVADTGVGIAPEDLPYVFDRFFRADRARVNNGGSGLGLSIAQKIAIAHGGSLSADSVPGMGSLFTLTLPTD